MDIQELLPELQNLYGKQARAIDIGDGRGWADTFTPDGVYDSPSYESAIRGRENLIDFGNQFPLRSPNSTHLVANVHIDKAEAGVANVILTFVIVQGEPGQSCEILRTVTAFDEVSIRGKQPLVHSRTVKF